MHQEASLGLSWASLQLARGRTSVNARSESERGSGAQRAATEVCHHPRSGESLFHVTDQQACTCQCVLPRPPEQPLGGRERPRDPFRASCPLPRGSRGHPGPGAPLRARQGTPSPTCVSRCVAPGRTPRGFAAAPLGVSVEGVASLPRGAEPEGCTPPPTADQGLTRPPQRAWVAVPGGPLRCPVRPPRGFAQRPSITWEPQGTGSSLQAVQPAGPAHLGRPRPSFSPPSLRLDGFHFQLGHRFLW